MSNDKPISMKVTFSPEEEAAYEAIADVTPWASRHGRLRAALRVGLRVAKENPEALFIAETEAR